MSSTKLVAAALTAVVVLRGSPAFADVSNGVDYSMPSGWVAAEKDGARVLAPANQKPGEAMSVRIIGAQAAAGTPDEQIAELASTLVKDTKVVTTSTVVATDRGAAGNFYMKTFHIESPHGAESRMIAILVRGEQRAVVMFVFTDDNALRAHGAGVQDLLKSIAIDPKAVTPKIARVSATATPAAATPPAETGHLATGETPNSYPGSPGWLPSGRGVPIPAPRIVKGRPEGWWWRYQADATTMFPLPMIFLADGTVATNPRPGSGQLFDVEAQRKQRGNTGVGSFSIKDGRITQAADGFTSTDTFKSGSDKDGEWFEIGAGRHYPLAQAPAKFITGTWRGGGNMYVLRTDGTFESGHITNNAEVTIAAGNRGTWQLDGYLIAFRPAGSPSYVTTIGRTGAFLIIGSSVLTRQ